MSFFVLTEVKPRVSQADIGVVIFRRSIDIFFPFNIVAFCLRNQIGIAQIFEIMIDCVGMKRDLFYAFKGIRQFFGVGKRADRGR